MRLVAWSAWGVCALLSFTSVSARAESPALISINTGVFDVLKDHKAGMATLEYRGRPLLWWFRPVLGGMLTTDTAAYAYGGLALEVWFGTKVVLTPSAVFGAYGHGNSSGKNLGATEEFRTGGELAWRFDNDSRLGIGFHHISNAGIGKHNPGTELLTVNYAMPWDRFFKSWSP